MSDRDLRSLERRAAQGDAQAAARLLRERVRAGTLSEERLHLAAHLGDRASRDAVWGELPFWVTSDHILWRMDAIGRAWWLRPTVRVFVEPITEAGREAAVRAAVAAAWAALSVWEEQQACDALTGGVCPAPIGCTGCMPRIALEAAEDWLLCPCEVHRTALRPGRCFPHSDPLFAWELTCAFTDSSASTPVWRVVSCCLESSKLLCPDWPSCLQRSSRLCWHGENRMREAIRSELLPWALGERDPVRERVGRRRAERKLPPPEHDVPAYLSTPRWIDERREAAQA